MTTLKEIKYEIKGKEADLERYLNKKAINWIKSQPGTVIPKNVITDGGNNRFDRFAHYVIKDEEYDKEIYAMTKDILSLQQQFISKCEAISELSELEHKIVIDYHLNRITQENLSIKYNYSVRQIKNILAKY